MTRQHCPGCLAVVVLADGSLVPIEEAIRHLVHCQPDPDRDARLPAAWERFGPYVVGLYGRVPLYHAQMARAEAKAAPVAPPTSSDPEFDEVRRAELVAWAGRHPANPRRKRERL